TLRDTTEWVETLKGGANRLVGADPGRILAAARDVERRPPRVRAGAVYGRGRASGAIARAGARLLGGAAGSSRWGACSTSRPLRSTPKRWPGCATPCS